MKILSEKELDDNVSFEVELTDEETDMLILAGLQKMIEDSGLPVMAIKASKSMKVETTKSHDLTPEETSELVNLGFNKVIKDYIDKQDALENERKPQE
jgi:hypothetical protein